MALHVEAGSTRRRHYPRSRTFPLRYRCHVNSPTISLTPEFLERQARILSILEKDKLFSKTAQANLSRPDRYKLGLAPWQASPPTILTSTPGTTRTIRWRSILLMMSYHITCILPCSYLQCENRQMMHRGAYWMPKLDSWEVIGAYAQTELGHGSNVRGIECEAKWDPKMKEFVINSPTLTASKWWNGTLGRTATHAVVIARLLAPEVGVVGVCVDHGPRPFIVRVRNAKTHLPPPSIIVGDIGPKYGYASNGQCVYAVQST